MGLSDFFKKRRGEKEARKKEQKQNQAEQKANGKNDTVDQAAEADIKKKQVQEEVDAIVDWVESQYFIETHDIHVPYNIIPRFDDDYIQQIEGDRSGQRIRDYIESPFYGETKDKDDALRETYFHKDIFWNLDPNERPQAIGKNFEYAIFEVIQEYLHPTVHLNRMNHLFKDKEHHAYVMANLLIPNGKGEETNEIDNMIISKKGIIVIEAKSHVGFFDGNIMDRKWNYYANREAYNESKLTMTMSNPFYQNASHITSIQRAINYSDYFGWVDHMNELAIDMEYKLDLEEKGINTQWILSDYDATYDLASMDLEEYEDFCNREPYPDPILAPEKEHFKGHYWDIPIISAVVVNNTTAIMPSIQEGLQKKLNRNYKLIRFCHLPAFLHDIFDTELLGGWPDVLTDKEVDYMYQTMCKYRNPSKAAKQKHVDFAKEMGRMKKNKYI